MSFTAGAFVCAILFLAGLLTGVTSFGGNLFAIPLLTLVMGIKEAIIFGCVASVVIFAGLPLLYRRFILWQEIFRLTLGAIIGIPAGIWILASSNPRMLMTGAAMCLFAFLLWQHAASRLRRAEKPLAAVWSFPAGIASGIMMASVGMGGPPLVLYAYLRRWGKEETISTANCAALLQMLAIVPLQWGQNLVDGNFGLAALGGLCALLGIFASIPVIGRVNLRLFRTILLLMLLVSALMLLARGVL